MEYRDIINTDFTKLYLFLYLVHSTMISPGSWVLYFAGDLCAQKLNKAQTKQVDTTGLNCFTGFWYWLCVHQQKLCQLCLVVYDLFITLPHSFCQILFSPILPPEYATALVRVGTYISPNLRHRQPCIQYVKLRPLPLSAAPLQETDMEPFFGVDCHHSAGGGKLSFF